MFTCAAQQVADADDEEDPERGGWFVWRSVSEGPVFRQQLEAGESEAQSGAAGADPAEEPRLEARDELGGRVAVWAAEGLQPRRSHDGALPENRRRKEEKRESLS